VRDKRGPQKLFQKAALGRAVNAHAPLFIYHVALFIKFTHHRLQKAL
jgi:hypothetical protein